MKRTVGLALVAATRGLCGQSDEMGWVIMANNRA